MVDTRLQAEVDVLNCSGIGEHVSHLTVAHEIVGSKSDKKMRDQVKRKKLPPCLAPAEIKPD